MKPTPAGSQTNRRRSASRTPAAQGRKPSPGTRFPSGAFGDNVRAFRQLRQITQAELAQWMNELGFEGWSRVTVSDVERGIRATSIDELFALALALKTYVVALLDPTFSGVLGQGLELGIPFPGPPADVDPKEDARHLILGKADPWERERGPWISYTDYRRKWEESAPIREAWRRENRL